MIREEQIEARRQRARASRLVIENVGSKRVFSTYRVTNPDSGGRYEVSIHGFATGDNTCTCPDYKSNTLLTCKHIEAVIATLDRDQAAPTKSKKAAQTRPEVALHYGETLTLSLRLPPRHSDKLRDLARRYFDARGLWGGGAEYAAFHAAAEAVPEPITFSSDALDFIGREAERAEMAAREAEWVRQLEAGTLNLPLLDAPLYDYQIRGALFLACRGRSILGDDMGLGKTVQTLAAVELLARERGIGRVLIVAPASVKYQWHAEIERFTARQAQVIDGSPEERLKQYALPTFYRLVNYEQVVRDRAHLNDWKPDLVVLDEAQRIKNWEAKTSREVKKLQSRYCMVLTGTPLENRLEELFSIVQFVDERRFGPAFQFLSEHRILDESGQLVGYRRLDTIREKLAPIFLRRTRAEVLTQLPARTDNTVRVPLSSAQAGPYHEQQTTLARLLQKGFLTELDRKRVLACLVNLRMICDSTYLFDGETRHSPKLDELAELVPELTAGGHKVVIFSQWETMVEEARRVLDGAGVPSAVLTGSLTGAERKAVLARFRADADCPVFLSTDAGGVGLNLQVADTVVNLELPWNPATLEQRVARVHRLGQERPVRVVNFVTSGTIEERVLKTLEQKQALFDGLFEGDEETLSLSGAAPVSFLQSVRRLLGEEPEPEPATPERVEPEAPLAASNLPSAAIWPALTQLLDALRQAAQAGQVPPSCRAALRGAADGLAGALGTAPGET